MSEHTFALNHLTRATFGGEPIKAISVTGTREVTQFSTTTDVHGNVVWTYSDNKTGTVQLVVSMSEKDTIRTLNRKVVAQDVDPITVPPVPFGAVDGSTQPESTASFAKCRIMGHPEEGYTAVDGKAESTLTYTLTGKLFLSLGGFSPD